MRQHRSWRQRAAPIIARVLAETRGQTEKEIRKALFDAYPFGVRAMYPYQIWLNEIRRQRGLKPTPNAKATRAARLAREQRDLFAEPEHA